MPEFEKRGGLFSTVTDRIQNLINNRQKVKVSASMAAFVEPQLSILPGPKEDPDSYDRYFILRSERDAFYGGNDILRPSDLDHEVMEWMRTNYPDSWSTQAIRLHFIKSGWWHD